MYLRIWSRVIECCPVTGGWHVLAGARPVMGSLWGVVAEPDDVAPSSITQDVVDLGLNKGLTGRNVKSQRCSLDNEKNIFFF